MAQQGIHRHPNRTPPFPLGCSVERFLAVVPGEGRFQEVRIDGYTQSSGRLGMSCPTFTGGRAADLACSAHQIEGLPLGPGFSMGHDKRWSVSVWAVTGLPGRAGSRVQSGIFSADLACPGTDARFGL
jgi:hypothetical protein